MTSLGFDSLPYLVTTRRAKHGLAFNLLFVGSSGIGKTSLINSLFDIEYGDSPDYDRSMKNVELCVKEFRPVNKFIEMKITLIETKGFDDNIDRTHVYQPIVDYIEEQNKKYLRNELKVQASKYNDIADTRVHCAVYIISSKGSGLTPTDLVTMEQLHKRVCLVPVIGKSEGMTKAEIRAMKRTVMRQLSDNGISTYSSEDLPFAVSTSAEIVLEDGKRKRIRQYPWGRMDIEKDTDFPLLRDLLLRSNMLDLIETTNRVHYERYRDEAVKEGHSIKL